MQFKRFLALFIVPHFAFCAPNNPVNYGAVRDGITTASFYAEEFTKGIASGDLLSTYQNVLGLAGQIHPALGAFAGGLQFIFSLAKGSRKPTENVLAVAIRQGFTEVSRLLDRNLNAVKNVQYELQIEIRRLSLVRQIDDLDSLVLIYEKYIENPDDLSLDDFLHACISTRIHEKPIWLAHTLTAEDPNNLKRLYLERGEKQKLNSHYEQIISLFFQATLMDTACTTAFYRNKDNDTVQMYIDRRGTDAEQYLREIGNALLRDSALFRKHFIQFALNDVAHCANEYANYDNQVATRCLNATFREKYERGFLAATYGSIRSSLGVDMYFYPDQLNTLIERHDGSCESYARYYTNYYSKNYAICFPSECASKQWKDAAFSCLDLVKHESCKPYVEDIVECLQESNIDFTTVGCFNSASSLGAQNRSLGLIYVATDNDPPFSLFICK